MPHIIIEYSLDSFENLSLPGLVTSVFDAVVKTKTVRAENIKVRAHATEFYKLGLAESGFIHVECRTHQGKTEEEKQVLSQAILDSIEAEIKKVAKHSMVITVEVVEMHIQSYAKAMLTIN